MNNKAIESINNRGSEKGFAKMAKDEVIGDLDLGEVAPRIVSVVMEKFGMKGEASQLEQEDAYGPSRF